MGKAIVKTARILRDELESNWLEVVLVPSRDPECAMRGGCIRVAHSYNADWYREFCKLYRCNRRRQRRRHDTKIKRQHTIAALKRLEAGRNGDTIYTQRLIEFIKDYDYQFLRH